MNLSNQRIEWFMIKRRSFLIILRKWIEPYQNKKAKKQGKIGLIEVQIFSTI